MTDKAPLRGPHRRSFAAGALLCATTAAGRTAAEPPQTFLRPQARRAAEPRQAPAQEMMIDVGGARLWCWDTGGTGEPAVLLHAGVGSGDMWRYQQPVFVKAGYRVVGYSRRGHYRSEAGPSQATSFATADLHAVVTQLGLARFHLVGTAAGGFIAPDYALSHPARVLSVTIANSLGGVVDPEYARMTAELTPASFNQMPPQLRELGPSYRAENPRGVARWIELERQAISSGGRIAQQPENVLSWTALATLRPPVLLLTGDADPYMPPSRQRKFARHLPRSKSVVIAECGHSAYWEQPEVFNRTLLEFFGRRSRTSWGA